MFAKVSFAVVIFTYLGGALSFDSNNVIFVIVGQTDTYHLKQTRQLKQSIHKQLQLLGNQSTTVHISHEDFAVPGDWTILPLLRPLVSKYEGSDVRWIVFLESRTVVRCDRLMQALRNADKHQAVEYMQNFNSIQSAVSDCKNTMWIGYPLRDEAPSSNHHLVIFEELEEEGGFVYPHFGSGFAMRKSLMSRLLHRINSGELDSIKWQFSIDPAFELARLIYGHKDDPGPLLTAEPSFCISPGEHCATYQTQFDVCGSAILENEIFFAIKTWSGFHDSRAVVVKKTWGQYVTNMLFFSDKTDPTLPSVDVEIPNMKLGHCTKTVEVLQRVIKLVYKKPHIKWIFLADDDTILGVQRLCEILSCFDGGSTVTMLGERYGFGYSSCKESGAKGYDYITGGGGTALSVAAAAILSSCACSSPTAPDDMALGACAARRNVTQIHLSLFHQARPQDYPREVLSRDRPVSFHRHSSPEPLKVYATWFQHDDLALKHRRKDEL